jgi:hypothetical protein
VEKLSITFILIGPNGKEIWRKKKRIHSFLKNWSRIHYLMWNQAATAILKDQTNATQAPAYTGSTFFMFAMNSSTQAWGILVGTGNTAVTSDDYHLATMIAHGSGSGQLVHGSMTVQTPTFSGNDSHVILVRSFTNSSGADITVKEVGMAYFDGTNSFMIVRDVLASPITVPAGLTLTAQYDYKVSA